MPARRVAFLSLLLAVAVLVGVSVLVLRDLAPEKDRSSPVVMSPPGGASDNASLREELRQRDETVTELRQRLAQLESRLDQVVAKLKSVEHEKEKSQVPGSNGPESDDPASDDLEELQITRTLHGATAWLQRRFPEEFADLTPEEAFYLRKVNLRGVEVTDEDLAHLDALPNVRQLNLRGTKITGTGLQHLPLGLETLDLTDTSVQADLLQDLPDLPYLKELRLNRMAVGDSVVEVLGRYPLLRHLEIDSTAISDEGLRRLLELNPALERIEMRGATASTESSSDLAGAYPGLTVVR